MVHLAKCFYPIQSYPRHYWKSFSSLSPFQRIYCHQNNFCYYLHPCVNRWYPVTRIQYLRYWNSMFVLSHDRSGNNNNNDNNDHQQPSAPPQPQHVVTMTSPTAPVQGVTQPELEMSLLKLQNQVMLQQLNAQGNQPHPQQAKAGGDGRGDINQLLALGLNRYPVVWRSKGHQEP